MTYFAFLALFVGLPLTALVIASRFIQRPLPAALRAWRPGAVIAALCLVALLYTTPWDNYLVATGVWYYNPKLVTGIVFGYVPLEEYTFFIVLPVLAALWLLLLARYLPARPAPANQPRIRVIAASVLFLIWLAAVFVLVMTFISPAHFKPGTYLALELAWALIPIGFQLAFGADILWRHKSAVLTAIITSTAYLSLADSVAIRAGTWTIEPAQSLNIFIGGVLPLEELVFFLLVNTLVVTGMVLVLAEESQPRAVALVKHLAFLRPLAQRLKRQEVNP